ncbi:MAG TPA: CPBP family intramembrane metalloprotease [Firmicutes bacterium]|nr:CPBP family intramembrane metalloprotease [Bacillota bacterium]
MQEEYREIHADSAVPADVEATPEAVRAVKKKLRSCSNRNSLAIFLFLVFGNVFTIILSMLIGFAAGLLGYVDTERMMTLANLAAALGLYVIGVPLVVLIRNLGKGHHRTKDYFARPQVSGGFICKWTVIGVGVAYLINYVCSFIWWLISLTGFEMHVPEMTSENSPLGIAVTMLMMAVLAPIFEELLCRGSLLFHTRAYGEWFAVITVGLMFGLLHANYQQIFFAAGLGIICGFVTVKAKSIWPAICIHFVLNLIGALQTVLLSASGLMEMEALDVEVEMTDWLAQVQIIPLLLVYLLAFLCLVFAIVALVLLVLEIVRHRDRLHLKNPCPILSTRQKFVTYFTAPGTICVVILLLVWTVVNMLGIFQ